MEPPCHSFLQFPSAVEQYDDLSRHSFDISLIEGLIKTGDEMAMVQLAHVTGHLSTLWRPTAVF